MVALEASQIPVGAIQTVWMKPPIALRLPTAAAAIARANGDRHPLVVTTLERIQADEVIGDDVQVESAVDLRGRLLDDPGVSFAHDALATVSVQSARN